MENQFFALYLCCSLSLCGGVRSETLFLASVSATHVLDFPVLSSPLGLCLLGSPLGFSRSWSSLRVFS
jgi:hypothetical protein